MQILYKMLEFLKRRGNIYQHLALKHTGFSHIINTSDGLISNYTVINGI